MTEDDIVNKLQRLKIADSEIPSVMRDVGMVVMGKIMETYLQALSASEREHFFSLDEAQQQQYISEHQSKFQPFTQEQFDAIHNDTWRDYFKSVA